MRILAVSFFALALAACATDAARSCATLAKAPWVVRPTPPPQAKLLEALLPKAPYETAGGVRVGSLRRLWYERPDGGLLACTLPRIGGDDCSIVVTELARGPTGDWVKLHDNSIICD